uniref:Uncharacterized protein n=1 Tax=Cyclophora tenuis TaxID=216820 RepID=A0A7S1D718_CYCTE|eukprot:CAMPEP_0116556780 /NCGR_PEP_ID=MMETSP0397-20121206/8879_1 /TAXON_ID=216820 /ORGANISM="Cyclophora tenuis, Strain ECT3854" /LENGTH=260 /DNA_ID=CAMNT_0004082173 /DNA_START=44 /DNA_END=826 /DNA_ORIENTATION=-
MPVDIAVRNREHFDLLGIKRCPSPEIYTVVSKKNSSLKKPKAPKKSVHFNEVVHVHFTLHVDDLNDDEYFRTWYQKRDFQMMRAEFAKTVVRIANGVHMGDSEEHCARGLEYRTKVGAQRRKLNKLHGLCAVLKEQDRQIDLGIDDDEALRVAYMRESHQCKQEALALGISDENESIAIRIEDEARLMRARQQLQWKQQQLKLQQMKQLKQQQQLQNEEDQAELDNNPKKKNRLLRFLDRTNTRRRRAVLEDIKSLRTGR